MEEEVADKKKKPDVRIIVYGSKSSADLSDFLGSLNNQEYTACSGDNGNFMGPLNQSKENIGKAKSQEVDKKYTFNVSNEGSQSLDFPNSLKDKNLEVPEIHLNWDFTSLPRNSATSRTLSAHSKHMHNTYRKNWKIDHSNNMSSWFNYGFTEDTFKNWIRKQLISRRIRLSQEKQENQ